MTGNIVKLPRIKQTKSVTGDISAQTVAADKNKTLSQVTVNPVSSSSLGTATPQDVLSGKTFSSGSGISVTGTGVKNVHVYGATWAGTSDPSWTRTDEAANFSDPNPYYAGMSGTPSSPFDGLMPWAGMRRVTDSTAGELVEIPKFYYKWTRSGSAMQLQIADGPMEGFYVSPAHADRGDGVGERDYVYVGRYHCASDYLSKTGVSIKTNELKSEFRTHIHNLGSNIYQNDFALYWTIRLLYLVEYANWNSQEKIGYGADYSNTTGTTDSIPYHTGTIFSSRTTKGAGTQYRYIEGLWDTSCQIIDGIYFTQNGSNIYVIKNPNNFSDNSNGTLVGQRNTSDGGYNVISWTNPTVSGYEYALIPYTVNTFNQNTYSCDIYYYYTTGADMLDFEIVETWWTGGTGLFTMVAANNSSILKSSQVSSRLMVLPSSRIN